MILSLCIALGDTPARAQSGDDPKSAMKALYAAVARADAPNIQKLLVVDGDTGGQLVGAYADLVVSGKKLADAAKQRYPGAIGAFAQGTILPEDEHLIDTADMKIDDDKATLKMSGRVEIIHLRRTSGRWRVLVAEADSTPQRREQQLAMLTGMTEVMTKTADEIADGQFNTIQDAEAAVKERLGAVLSKALQKSTPSTGPATNVGDKQ